MESKKTGRSNFTSTGINIIFFWLFFTLSLYSFNSIIEINKGYDRVTIKFYKPFNTAYLHFFELKGKNNHRYVFDFRDTQLVDRNIHGNIEENGEILSIRASQYKRNVARLVIETKNNYSIKYYKADSYTFVINLPEGTTQSMHIRGLFSSLRRDSITNPKPNNRVITTQKKSIRDSYLMQNESAIRPKTRSKYRIVLDPGHGGHDSGALGGADRRKMEKVAVLQIAKRVARHLRHMGFDVIMTRNSDRFIKLSHRTRFANRRHGDIFVSIHANAVPRRKWNRSHGIETYFLQVTRSARAKRVAARENSVVLSRKDRISKNVILDAIYTGPKIVLSNKLAIDVQRSILSHLRSKYNNVKDGGVRPAPFWVLVGAEMPAILIETGYITNPMERKRLFDPKYQELMAQGIAKGIARYLANREKEIE